MHEPRDSETSMISCGSCDHTNAAVFGVAAHQSAPILLVTSDKCFRVRINLDKTWPHPDFASIFNGLAPTRWFKINSFSFLIPTHPHFPLSLPYITTAGLTELWRKHTLLPHHPMIAGTRPSATSAAPPSTQTPNFSRFAFGRGSSTTGGASWRQRQMPQAPHQHGSGLDYGRGGMRGRGKQGRVTFGRSRNLWHLFVLIHTLLMRPPCNWLWLCNENHSGFSVNPSLILFELWQGG